MRPEIFTSHVGYLPDAEKRALVAPQHVQHEWFVVYDCGALKAVDEPHRLKMASSEWGPFGVADFSDFRRPGMYQIILGDNEVRSVPFTIADDVYVKTLRLAFQFIQNQRCGTAVTGFHGPCHLDDAVMRDTGRPVDVAGGWHDAGDLRKWMSTTPPVVMGLVELHEQLAPRWDARHTAWGDVLDEARWENDYYLKMQDPDTGMVWKDTAGGINGDNSDNYWSDNERGTGDERHVNPDFVPAIQWDFVAVQAHVARAFAGTDHGYCVRCREAAERCLRTLPLEPAGRYAIDARAVRALAALHRLTGKRSFLAAAHRHAASLLACQCSSYEHQQEAVRGFFYDDVSHATIHKSHGYSAVGLVALAHLLACEPEGPRAQDYRNALQLYVDEYALPIASRNPFGILPYGLYTNPPVDGATVHHLAGELSFRYFKWREASSLEAAAREKETFEHGGTSHLLNQAVGLLHAARLVSPAACRQLALKQLEWVMGANPLGMCLMTGGGINTPYPHSRFTALSPGGILNGFIGGHADVPWVSDDAVQEHWETTEYWLPHNGNYIRAIGLLYEGFVAAV